MILSWRSIVQLILTTVVVAILTGMNFQRRRNSSFIDGVGADAWTIAEHIGRSMVGTRVA